MVLLGLALLAVPLLSVLGFVSSYRTRARLAELADTVAVLEKRIVALSALAHNRWTPQEKAPPVASPTPRQTPVPMPSPELSSPVAVAAPVIPDSPDTAAAAASQTIGEPTPATPAFNWEQLVGIRGAAWVGGIALVIAALFFARWTIDRGFFTPAIRVACLLFGGVGAVVWAELRRREGFRATAGPVSSAGIVMLDVAFFAGHNLYNLFGILPAFIGMSLVTAAAAVLALRYAAVFNALLGVIGGLATPVLLSSGSSRPEGLFLYLILLNAGYLLVAKRQRWQAVIAVLVAGTSAIQMAWYSGTAAPDTLTSTLVLFSLLAIVYASHALHVDRAEQPWSFVAVEVGSAVALLYGVAALDFREQWPAVFAYLAVVDLLLIYVSSRGERRWPIAATGIATALTFVFSASSWSWSIIPALAAAMIAFAIAFISLDSIARRVRATWLAAQCDLTGAVGLVVTAGMFSVTLGSALSTDTQPPMSPGLQFGWLAVDAALVLVVAGRLGWTLLVPATAAGVVLFSAAWQFSRFEPATATTLGLAYVGFYVFFLGLPFIAHGVVASWRDRRAQWLTSALIGPVYLLIFRDLALRLWGDAWIGLLPLTMAGLTAIALKGVDRQFPLSENGDRERLRHLALFATIALGFVAVAISLQVGRQWITIGWAIEAAAVCWLSLRLRHPALKVLAVALFAVVGFRLLATPELLRYEPRGAPIFNWLLYTYVVPIGCCFAGAHLLRRQDPKRMASGIALLALVLIFWLINLEIADFYSTGRYIELDFSRHFERDLVRSLAWGAYALALMGIGIWKGSRDVRIVSLGVLLLTIGKVFLYDLALLGGFYRVLSFLALGIALIIVSMLYQRYVPHPDTTATTM